MATRMCTEYSRIVYQTAIPSSFTTIYYSLRSVVFCNVDAPLGCAPWTFEPLNRVCVVLHWWSWSIMDYMYILGQLTYINTYTVLLVCGLTLLVPFHYGLCVYTRTANLSSYLVVHWWSTITYYARRIHAGRHPSLWDKQQILVRMLSSPEKEAHTHTSKEIGMISCVVMILSALNDLQCGREDQSFELKLKHRIVLLLFSPCHLHY